MRTKGHGTELIYISSVAQSDLYTFIEVDPKCLAQGLKSHPCVWTTSRKIMSYHKKGTFFS